MNCRVGAICTATPGRRCVADDVDLFRALHLGRDLSSRRVAVGAGAMMFCAKGMMASKAVARMRAGNPEVRPNALLAVAQATPFLCALPRRGRFATKVNVSDFETGSARNVIAPLASRGVALLRRAPELASTTMKRRPSHV
jgi:aminobenzoyl-glutamate utilization protein A